MKTPSRRNWGRVYEPGVAFSQYDAVYGRPTNAMCDTLASAWRTMLNNLVAKSTSVECVVFSKQYQANLVVSEVACDNVPDIIRRRRPKNPSYRKTFTS